MSALATTRPNAGNRAATVGRDRQAVAELAACSECGQLHRIPANFLGRACCVRCGATVNDPGAANLETPLALACAALPLFAVAAFWPLLSVHMLDGERTSSLLSTTLALGTQGFWVLSPWVAMIAIGAPLCRIGGLVYVLGGLTFGLPAPRMDAVMKFTQRLRVWAMADVVLLGALVAYSRLRGMAEVRIGVGGYALIAAVAAIWAMEAALDQRRVWRALASRAAARIDPQGDWLACHECGAVSLAASVQDGRCPRCASRLRRRKPDSIGRGWAFLVAGALLYVPANFLPVLLIDRMGQGQSNTILSGVRALIASDMLPLAAIVFLASIVIPILKLAGLGLLLVSVQLRWRGHVYERTRFFRFIERIGRWSNIDVFAVAILTALIQFGNPINVRPGPGIVPFALVVFLTMMASHSFDPRLIWDAAATPHGD